MVEHLDQRLRGHLHVAVDQNRFEVEAGHLEQYLVIFLDDQPVAGFADDRPLLGDVERPHPVGSGARSSR